MELITKKKKKLLDTHAPVQASGTAQDADMWSEQGAIQAGWCLSFTG